MSLTLLNAIQRVRDILNESVSVFWTDTEITNWIQEGCRDWSTKSLMVEDTVTIPLVANQIDYDSGDVAAIGAMLEPYACFYNDGLNNWKGIIKINPRVIGNEATNTPGDPKMYALHNKTIWVWPPPTSAMVTAGAYLRVLHSKTTDDITLIQDEHQHIPIIYAQAKAKYKDQKFAEGNALMTIYLSSTSFERQDKHAREEDTLDMFKIKPRGGQQGAQ
jgi:hypothetical protein